MKKTEKKKEPPKPTIKKIPLVLDLQLKDIPELSEEQTNASKTM